MSIHQTDTNENTPLLKPRNTAKMFFLIPKSIIMLILATTATLTGFVVLNCAIVLPNAQEHLQTATKVSINDIEFVKVAPSFASVEINAGVTVAMGYHDLHSSYYEAFYSVAGQNLQYVKLAPEPVEIRVVIQTASGPETVSLGDVKVPPFKVNIANNAITELSLPIVLSLKRANLYRFLKQLSEKMQNGDTVLPFMFFFDTSMSVSLRWIPVYRPLKISVVREIDLAPQIEANLAVLETILLQESEKSDTGVSVGKFLVDLVHTALG